MELIQLEDIHKTYQRGAIAVPVLRGTSLSITRGEMVALMGESGSGKTTLMNILGCLDRPTSGRYWFDGQEMSRLSPNQRALVRTEKIGFVFQSFNLLPRTTSLQNVLLPLDYARRRASSGEACQLAGLMLHRVGLSDRTGYEPSRLSGGQQQRVAIARALVNQPLLLLADEPTGNLDSRAGDEILRMFQQLNAQGITVILVTHDYHVAAYAHRTIHIHDGRIVAEGVVTGGGEICESRDCGPARSWHVAGRTEAEPASGCATSVAFDRRVFPIIAGADPAGVDSAADMSGSKDREQDMFPRQSLRRRAVARIPRTAYAAWRALRRNKMRTGLTALGVIIGVAAVIAMLEIGEGSKIAIQKTMASMGANTIMIHAGEASSSGVSAGEGSAMTLTPQDADEIGRQCPSVAAVAPLVRARVQVIYKNRNWMPMQVSGTTPSFLAVRDWQEFSEGDMFTEQDVRSMSKVCVVGETLRRELFRDESPVGKEIRVQNVPFVVIGVLSRKGANMMGMDQDDIVLAPWTTIKYRVFGSSLASAASSTASLAGGVTNRINTLNNLYPGSTPRYIVRSASQLVNNPQLIRFANVDHMYAKAASSKEVEKAMEQITVLLRERHQIGDGETDDFRVSDMAEVSKAMYATSQSMGSLLLVVALISLVVGGVGIMNIMLVSVTERTREIGLRMAVGARNHHILWQFLVEALVLCLCGGALGICLGRGTSIVVRSVLSWPTEPSLLAIAAAAAVSAAVGIIFGFFPAWKASQLDPIDALRYD
jgi:macrolide transport system ATP-binding/permease protein